MQVFISPRSSFPQTEHRFEKSDSKADMHSSRHLRHRGTETTGLEQEMQLSLANEYESTDLMHPAAKYPAL